jgi:hypothetical protein
MDMMPYAYKIAEDKGGVKKDSFYKELEHVFNQFTKYHKKILFEDFIVKGERRYFQITNWE